MVFKKIVEENQLLMIGIGYLVGRSLFAFLETTINHLIMPLFIVILGGTHWEKASITLFNIDIKWGALMASCLHFIIALTISVYLIHWFVTPKKPSS